MNFLKEKTFTLGAAYYFLVSLAIILFASPLFRVLGFEYSGVIALFASIHLLYYSAHKTWAQRGADYTEILKKLWVPVFFLSSIPFFISIISALFIPNCSLWDGFIFYIEIVYPTVLIALLSGIFFASRAKSKRAMNITVAIFWIATLLLSLLPGYFSGRIYTYGWQYGYFPGFVWDEAMELSSGYWLSRVMEVTLVVSWIVYQHKIKKERYTKDDYKKIRQAYTWQYWFMIALSAFFGMSFSKIMSDDSIEHFLKKELAISKTQVHYASASFSDDELQLLKFNVKKYQEEIDSIYHIEQENKIDIYIFPTSDDLYNYIGTREASISKPWRHAIYIAKPNLHSLKHELAHILLAPYGSFPFDISWSTGLTEGAAVAIEDDYDGIESVDYFSAKTLQMGLATGVRQVMQPSGFLSSAPSQSYVLSGSFTKYLLDHFGVGKFLDVYNDRDFEKHYGQEISSLESGWKHSLMHYQSPMDHYDSLRILFYFKRTSVLREPCLRRIGKLLKNADAAFRQKDYRLADSLYATIERESGRLKAIRGRVLSQLFLNNPAGAFAILDTTASAKEPNNLAALRMLRGDVIALATGDLNKASVEWEEAMRLQLGESYFLASFLRTFFLGRMKDTAAVKSILRDLYGIEETKDKYALVFRNDSSHYELEFYKAQLFLYVSYIEKTGRLKEAYQIWRSGANTSTYRSYESDLFDKLIEKKYSHYAEIFQ